MELVTTRGDEFELFVPLSKINEKTGEFEAWATIEEVDQSGEIIDLDKSWPYFEALASRFSKVTDGANFGPLREQHDPNKASGHLIAPPVIKTHESGARGIYINGIVTDDGTRAKLNAKTLTGVSIGGKYVGDSETVKVDGREIKRFVADPNHYGVVDSPCVKNALVTVIKSDGSEHVEKLIGFNPEQGFLCRGGGFHVKKVDATHCEDGHPLTKAVPNVVVDAPAVQEAVVPKIEVADAAKKATQNTLLEKCLYCVSSLASAIQYAQGVASSLEYESRNDADGGEDEDQATEQIEAGIAALYDALLAIVADEKADFTEEDQAEDAYAVMALAAIGDRLKKSTTARQLMKVLYVPNGNGSDDAAHKEQAMNEVQKSDGAALTKAQTDAITEAVASGLAKSLEPVTAKVDAIEKAQADKDGTIDSLEKSVATLTKTLGAIVNLPAPAKAVKRVSKADDGVEDVEHDKPAAKAEATDSMSIMKGQLAKPQPIHLGTMGR